MRVVRYRRLPGPARLRMYEDHVANIPFAAVEVLRGQYDLVHAFFPAEAWAAIRARRLGGPPVVFSNHGIPARRHLVDRRYRLEIMSEVVREADAVSVLSEAAAAEARRLLQVDPVVLPGGVITKSFEGSVARSETPTAVCAASLWDRRKRADLLFSAWSDVLDEVSDAQLHLVRQRDPLSNVDEHSKQERRYQSERVELADGSELPLPDGVGWVEADDTDELAARYAAAWISVLPSVNEAFGLVVAESLASGTPVVAARSGACPEILTDELLGALFEPDDRASLAGALVRALRAPPAAKEADACRERASAFDWNLVVKLYEDLYAAVAT